MHIIHSESIPLVLTNVNTVLGGPRLPSRKLNSDNKRNTVITIINKTKRQIIYFEELVHWKVTSAMEKNLSRERG